MKYSKIQDSPVNEVLGDGPVRIVHLERSCKECGFILRGEEKFCPECGHKLLRLEEKVPEDFILGFLNGRYKTIARGEEGNDDVASVTAKDIPNVSCHVQNIQSGESLNTPKCLRGLDKETCGYCTPNGACGLLQMCPFHGEGFIDSQFA